MIFALLAANPFDITVDSNYGPEVMGFGSGRAGTASDAAVGTPGLAVRPAGGAKSFSRGGATLPCDKLEFQMRLESVQRFPMLRTILLGADDRVCAAKVELISRHGALGEPWSSSYCGANFGSCTRRKRI